MVLKISVVVPVYNEEGRIGKTLSKLSGYLGRNLPAYEMIIINDGSTDKTGDILKTVPTFKTRILHNPSNHGKGFAVRQGVLESKGDVVIFTDADLSTPPQEIKKFALMLERDRTLDILIGSRSIPGADLKIRQPCYRQNMGRVFNLFVRLLTPLRFHDTQCGFKAFRREAAKRIFSELKTTGFAFDVEALILAGKFGYKTKEVPVTWVNNARSQVRPVADSLRMIKELLNIKRRLI